MEFIFHLYIIITFTIFSFFLILHSPYLRSIMTHMTQSVKNGVRTRKKLCHALSRKRDNMTQKFCRLSLLGEESKFDSSN